MSSRWSIPLSQTSLLSYTVESLSLFYCSRWWEDIYCIGDRNPCNLTQANTKRRRRTTFNFRYKLVNVTAGAIERRVIIDNLSPYTKYGFNVQEKTEAGWGPYSKEQFSVTSAGSKLWICLNHCYCLLPCHLKTLVFDIGGLVWPSFFVIKASSLRYYFKMVLIWVAFLDFFWINPCSSVRPFVCYQLFSGLAH